MGTWGSGNLDSDSALDEIGERSRALVETMWGRMFKSESWEADEWEHHALMVDLETIIALEAAGVFDGWQLPEPERADAVIETWLASWAEYYPGLGPSPEFMAERREVLEKTFARFREICAKYHEMRTAGSKSE